MAIVRQLALFDKTCRKCAQAKPLDDFAKARRSPDGREHNCRDCRTPNKPPPIHTLQDGVKGKTCRECSQWQPLTEYHLDKRMSDRRCPRCKTCRNAKTQRYRDADPIKWRAGLRASYYRHVEVRKAKVRVARQANSERVRADDRARRWRYYDKQRWLIYAHTRRARKRKSEGQFTPAEWRALQAQHGSRCLRCGRTDVKLTPDHIVPLSVGGSNAIQNIQPLCLPCNRWKAAKTIDFRPVG